MWSTTYAPDVVEQLEHQTAWLVIERDAATIDRAPRPLAMSVFVASLLRRAGEMRKPGHPSIRAFRESMAAAGVVDGAPAAAWQVGAELSLLDIAMSSLAVVAATESERVHAEFALELDRQASSGIRRALISGLPRIEVVRERVNAYQSTWVERAEDFPFCWSGELFAHLCEVTAGRVGTVEQHGALRVMGMREAMQRFGSALVVLRHGWVE